MVYWTAGAAGKDVNSGDMSRQKATSSDRAALGEIELPGRYNYVAAFLTLGCNLRCSYCINWLGAERRAGRLMSGADWLLGLNRLVSRPDLPVTLQGGEPSLHPDFHQIINGLRGDLNIDILTNLQFDVEEFIAAVAPQRLRRDAPYASIRVSYHPEVMDLAQTKAKVLRLLEKGYSVGIWAVRHPAHSRRIEQARDECTREGIDFRLKEFLGFHEGRLFGRYKYPDAVAAEQSGEAEGDVANAAGGEVLCRTSELIIGPSGDVYRCHGDLYRDRKPVGHILDEAFVIEDVHRSCGAYGQCNPCDVKVKTDRFQQYGHTSVDIRFP